MEEEGGIVSPLALFAAVPRDGLEDGFLVWDLHSPLRLNGG